MRAFLVVNCQSALVWLALRSCSQAAISSMRICLLGMRRSRHWVVRTPSSDSARSSQLPCFGPDRAVAGTIANAEFYVLVLQPPQSRAFASLVRLGTGQVNQLGLLPAGK